tara:strand:+ start:142 stop:390 length:249 start_codon:yes stop_codon:yes gene_type:complete
MENMESDSSENNLYQPHSITPLIMQASLWLQNELKIHYFPSATSTSICAVAAIIWSALTPGSDVKTTDEPHGTIASMGEGQL